MRLDNIEIDTVSLEDGDWIDNIPELENLRLKVRGLNNRDYRNLERRLIAAVPRKKRMNAGGTMDVEEQDRITNTCILNTVLLDWDGLTQQNGSDHEIPILYSKEMARKLLFEPQYRRFRDGVIWAATMVVERDRSKQEEVVKN